MKKKILELIAQLKAQLEDSRQLKSIYSEYDMGYVTGMEEQIEKTIKDLEAIIPEQK